jgi:hypothetical protein
MRAKSIACINNLKQTGLGIRLWANDQGDKYPWNIGYTNVNGGSAGSPDWTDNFRVCSNELVMPNILLCPADTKNTLNGSIKTAGANWTLISGDANISYFVGTLAQMSRPQSILLGDYNVAGGGGGLDPSWSTFLGTSIDATWDQTLHIQRGNLALADGSARGRLTPDLRDQILADLAAGATNVVFSKPRGVF